MSAELRKFYEELKDIKYVVGIDADKTYINSEKQLLAVAKLFSVYKDGFFEDESGKHPYIVRSIDDSNQPYLKIEIDKVMDAHLIKENSKKFKRTTLRSANSVPDYVDSDRVDDITLEDMLEFNILSENGFIEFQAPMTCGDVKHQRFSRMDKTCWTDICLFEKYDRNSLRISRFYIN